MFASALGIRRMLVAWSDGTSDGSYGESVLGLCFLCGEFFLFSFFFLNDCFSLAVFMGLLKLLVCPWFNFGRSHISRGLFISSRLPDSFEMCVFKAFPNNFLDFIGVQ